MTEYGQVGQAHGLPGAASLRRRPAAPVSAAQPLGLASILTAGSSLLVSCGAETSGGPAAAQGEIGSPDDGGPVAGL